MSAGPQTIYGRPMNPNAVAVSPEETYTRELSDEKFVKRVVYDSEIKSVNERIQALETKHELENLEEMINEKVNTAKLEILNERLSEKLLKGIDFGKWGVTTLIAIAALLINLFK